MTRSHVDAVRRDALARERARAQDAHGGTHARRRRVVAGARARRARVNAAVSMVMHGWLFRDLRDVGDDDGDGDGDGDGATACSLADAWQVMDVVDCAASARGADAGTTTRGRVLKLTLINAAGDALAAIERERLTDIGTMDDVRPGVKIAFRRAMTTRVCGAVVVGGDDVRVLGGGADALTKEWRHAAVARATRERDDTTMAVASTAPKFHPFDASKEIEIRVSRGQPSAASVSSRLARVEISPPTPPPRATTAANDAEGAAPIITPRVKPALPPSRAKPP